MTAARLILLLLLILVAVVLVVLVLRRGSAQRDAQRVEAAGLRTDADTLASTVAGQSVFADQAAQRAELARVEAEDKAREAARLEEEAAEHRAAAEATRREYEATMRRADDIDPDVKKSAFPAVPDRADEVTATDQGERDSAWAAPSAASSAATAGAAGGAAAGATAWAARDDDDHSDGSARSERVASAADFRDDVPAETEGVGSGDDVPDGEAPEVYRTDAVGSRAGMSDESRNTDEPTTHDDGTGAGAAASHAAGGDATASAGTGGAYAATRELHEETARDEQTAVTSRPTGATTRTAATTSTGATTRTAATTRLTAPGRSTPARTWLTTSAAAGRPRTSRTTASPPAARGAARAWTSPPR